MKDKNLYTYAALVCVIVFLIYTFFNSPESAQVIEFQEDKNGLRIGDLFYYSSKDLDKGFVLINMNIGGDNNDMVLYDFAPIILDTFTLDSNKIIDSKIRLVPKITSNGLSDTLGAECLSFMGQEDIQEFLKYFNKTGHIDLIKNIPVHGSSYMPSLEIKEIENFFNLHEMTWGDEKKFIQLKEFVD